MRILIIIGLCGVALFLFFGSNPLRDYQNQTREAMKKYGDDPLTIATTYYIEQKEKEGSGATFGFGGGSQPVGTPSENELQRSMLNSGQVTEKAPVNPMIPASPNTPPDYGNPSLITAKVAQPDASLPEDIAISAEPARVDPVTNTQQSGGIRDYYPPVVERGNPVVAMNQQLAPPPANNVPKLRTGQAIAFDGEFVYLLDQYGVKSIIPDGQYNLMDGSQMVVVNGKRMLQ